MIITTLIADERLDKVSTKIIDGLDKVKVNVKKQFPHSNIRYMEVDINDVGDQIKVSAVPSLVYFKNGEPIPYDGESIKQHTLLDLSRSISGQVTCSTETPSRTL